MVQNAANPRPFEAGELNEEGQHVHPGYQFPMSEGDRARQDRKKEGEGSDQGEK